MSREGLPKMVGNDFLLPKQQLQTVAVAPTAQVANFAMVPGQVLPTPEFIPHNSDSSAPEPYHTEPTRQNEHPLKRHARGYGRLAFAVIFLILAIAAVELGGNYYSSRITSSVQPVTSVEKATPRSIAGLNTGVSSANLDATVKTITSQPATMTVGTNKFAIPASTIKSWLKITPSTANDTQSIHVDTAAINKSLLALANQYVKAPVNQITVTYSDGTTGVIGVGRNGTKLTDPSGLKPQAVAIAKNLLSAKGFSVSTPLATEPYHLTTAAAIGKLIEVDLTIKHMYLYQNGALYKEYDISAGKPSTPTPVGQFKIFSKLAVQDMRGYNADGTRYFQPSVHWINYFLTGGYAIHGVYWHPQSWFGANNSSHGCVGLPDDQAKEVYDWAPIGTTVVTHL